MADRHNVLGLLLFLLLVGTSIATNTMNEIHATTTASDNPPAAAAAEAADTTKIVFSDVDGTLVHYPETIPTGDNEKTIALPPSSTGMRAIISHRTLRQCREIRQKDVRFVLVSGMRTSTLLSRLPFLPRADAYCSEAGGRIFYPTTIAANDTENNVIQPMPFQGATDNDLKPFGLREDLEWRKRMEEAAGTDGFVGQELAAMMASSTSFDQLVPISQRKGPLWEYSRLLGQNGLTLDTKGYATSFRVTAKQQQESSMETFRALLHGEVFPCPPMVTTRTNLGSLDFYPSLSGKKNVCEYLAMKLVRSKLSEHAVCMGDDDNDIEMALACRHAFIPTVTSETMAETITKHRGQFTTVRNGVEGTEATEMALQEVLNMLQTEEKAA